MRKLAYHFWPYFLSSVSVLGIYFGGYFSAAGIIIIFIIHPLLDHLLTKIFGDEKSTSENSSNLSLYLWPLFQTILLFYSVQTLSQETNFLILTTGTISLGIITGGFGITIAHELVHRPSKWQRGLGVWILATVNYAVFRIEHVHGHHRHVATPDDPASAKKGENIYFFIPKAIVGVFKGAKKIEDKRIAKLKIAGPWKYIFHRCYQYHLSSILLIAGFYFLFGLKGVYIFLLQSFVAISLLEMVDFIEHYGLQRKIKENGKYEPVGPEHSWDTNFLLTNTSLYNLGKHAHHHQSASLSYQSLINTEGAHNYPFGYSTAVILALIPPLWRKVVDPLLPNT